MPFFSRRSEEFFKHLKYLPLALAPLPLGNRSVVPHLQAASCWLFSVCSLENPGPSVYIFSDLFTHQTRGTLYVGPLL